MASTSTTRASPPHHTEPFPPLETAPRTPTSISSSSVPTTTSGAAENPNLLRPHSSQKVGFGLSPKSIPERLSPGASALTGAAAMAEMKRRKQHQQINTSSRQTSPNPAVTTMQSLMGTGGMSRPADAPAPDKLSEPLRKAAEKINVPETNMQVDSSEEQVSPVSLGSFGRLESGTDAGSSMTATANDNQTSAPGQHFVAEPAQMTEGENYQDSNENLAVPDQEGNKHIAYSYPGPPQQDQGQEGGPARGMSLPGFGQGSPNAPASNKRHKCPYCSTDFTRHHNLKSHLLTHSQEKPYVCQTCQARFRRLHDLKRHTKLHTGERPHTCDKCGRRFARGDALARHNKGPGGCAGRRSSFGGEDDYGPDGEGMEGVEYEEGDEGSDDHARRVSEPNRKRQQLETPQDPNRQVYRQHSSTYPPAPQNMRGNMGPPQVVHPGSSTATSPREMSGQPSPAGGSSLSSAYYGQGQVFAEPGMMTSSPRPLSPGQPPDQHRLSVADGSGPGSLQRNRSTSLTRQFQQQHFGRSADGRTPPVSNAQFPPNQQGTVHLPPLGGNGQPQPRGGLQPSSLPGGPASNMLGHHQQQVAPGSVAQGSNPGSLSSHGRSSGSSMRDHLGQDPNDIWSYVRSLESRFSRMQDEYELRISRLQEDLISLKGQLGQMSNAASYSSDMGGQRGPYP